jgi:hypothetical protein
MKIYLRQSFFSEKEKTLLENDRFKVSIFNFASGVEAVRIRTMLWEMVWLPFLGQQIWDFSVNGQSIKMVSPVSTPSQGVPFTQNYGALFLHCGISGMGNPAPRDSHPLHGELPDAPFQDAWVIFEGDCLVLGGNYAYRNTHGICYDFSPQIVLDHQKSWFSIKCSLTNNRQKSMPYQYLAHINLLPGYDDQIISTAVLTPKNVEIRKNPPLEEKAANAYESFFKYQSDNPIDLNSIKASHIYDPEMVLWFSKDKPISDKWCYTLLQKNKTEALFVGYNPETLDHAIRWIFITSEMQAAGIMLPATSETEGFMKETEKGNIKFLQPEASVCFEFQTGKIIDDELLSLKAKLNQD